MSVSAFFDEISGGMSREEAFMALLLAAVWSDLKEDLREVEEKRALERRTRTLSTLTPEQLVAMKDRLRPRLVADRFNHLVEDACSSLANEKPDVRLSIFAHCVDIVFCDRRLDKMEKSFLTDLTARLKIDDQDATNILKALKEKNMLR